MVQYMGGCATDVLHVSQSKVTGVTFVVLKYRPFMLVVVK